MEPSSQEQEPTPTPEQPVPQAVQVKKSKKPLIITLVILAVLVIAGCAAWFWWSAKQTAPKVSNDLGSTKLPPKSKSVEPNTVVYSYRPVNSQAQYDLAWRPADGGEQQNSATKAYVSSALTYGNQVVIETYTGTDKQPPTLLYSSDGGKTYKTLYTGKAPASENDFGDQITGMQFASDGKSIVFALLPNNSKNTVKQIYFDKPNEVIDLMTTDARGVFLMGYNAKVHKLYFFEGCYNCDGNGASVSVYAYDTVKKQRSTLVNGADKHLGIVANKSATKLVITAPTVDKTKTSDDGAGSFWGYYVGAPFTVSVFDLESATNTDISTVVGSETDNAYVRAGFMADDTTPYYYKNNQLYSFGKASSTLLYEAGQPFYEVHYVSPTTVFAATGTYENYTLNRFSVKTQETKQILTAKGDATRILGITEN